MALRATTTGRKPPDAHGIWGWTGIYTAVARTRWDKGAQGSGTMRLRYRRLIGRYTRIVSIGEALSPGDLLRGPRATVMVAPPHWRPPADVCETAAAITVTVEVAGVDPDDLEVLLFEDALVVEGERRLQACAPDGVYHSAEIRHGPFRLQVHLPAAVDGEGIDARYDRGLLHIVLPKAARAAGGSWGWQP